LTPLYPKLQERLEYVIIESLDFRDIYNRFYRSYYKKKGLTKEVFIYADEPYPGTEKYYGNLFKPEDHQDLINICLETPFNVMLSTGGDCGIYLDALGDAGWFIKKVHTRYSTNANSQKLTKEYICMNYDIKKLPKMIMDNQPDIMDYIEV